MRNSEFKIWACFLSCFWSGSADFWRIAWQKPWKKILTKSSDPKKHRKNPSRLVDFFWRIDQSADLGFWRVLADLGFWILDFRGYTLKCLFFSSRDSKCSVIICKRYSTSLKSVAIRQALKVPQPHLRMHCQRRRHQMKYSKSLQASWQTQWIRKKNSSKKRKVRIGRKTMFTCLCLELEFVLATGAQMSATMPGQLSSHMKHPVRLKILQKLNSLKEVGTITFKQLNSRFAFCRP